MPPQTFDRIELEALALGLAEVRAHRRFSPGGGGRVRLGQGLGNVANRAGAAALPCRLPCLPRPGPLRSRAGSRHHQARMLARGGRCRALCGQCRDGHGADDPSLGHCLPGPQVDGACLVLHAPGVPDVRHPAPFSGQTRRVTLPAEASQPASHVCGTIEVSRCQRPRRLGRRHNQIRRDCRAQRPLDELTSSNGGCASMPAATAMAYLHPVPNRPRRVDLRPDHTCIFERLCRLARWCRKSRDGRQLHPAMLEIGAFVPCKEGHHGRPQPGRRVRVAGRTRSSSAHRVRS